MSDRFVRTFSDDEQREVARARLACPQAFSPRRPGRASSLYDRALREATTGGGMAHTTGIVYPWRGFTAHARLPAVDAPRATSVLDAPGCARDACVALYDVSRLDMLAASLGNVVHVVSLDSEVQNAERVVSRRFGSVRVEGDLSASVRWSDDVGALFYGTMFGRMSRVDVLTMTRVDDFCLRCAAGTRWLTPHYAMEPCASGALAVGSAMRVYMVDVRDANRIVGSVSVSGEHDAYALSASPDGVRLAVGTNGDGAHLVDMRVMRSYAHVMRGGNVKCVSWCPDRRDRLVLGDSRAAPEDAGASCFEACSSGAPTMLWHARTAAPASGAFWGDGVVTLFTGWRDAPAGTRAAVAPCPEVFVVADAATGATCAVTANNNELNFTHMAASPVGTVAVTACPEQEMLFVHRADAAAARRSPPPRKPQTLALR